MVLAPALPFRRIGPAAPPSPLVIAVPHAGRIYPPDLLNSSAVPLAVLEQLEDRHADRLIGPVVEAGAVAIVARLARAWIDLNRSGEDVEDASRPPAARGAPPSARARSGLGLIPSRLGGRSLWRQSIAPEQVAHRLAHAHEPYHRALADALAAARRAHGRALLIDCHSMPPLPGATAPQVVIGDLHGRAASHAVAAAAMAAARTAGLRVALNSPYAGAYTLLRHGAPARGIDALQVEFDRALYLDRALRAPGAGLERVSHTLAALAWAAVEAQAPRAIAAE